MADTTFLCALDLVESLVLKSSSTEFQVWGWIIAADAGVAIDEVFIDCDGKGRFRTSFPQPRPDVKSHYPDLENSANSGFVSSSIPLQSGTDESVDIRVIAKCDGVEHSVLTKQVKLVWFDPDNELFSLGKIGPFAFPEEFDEDRLTRFPDCAPTFLIGNEAGAKSARRAVGALGPHLSEGDIFQDLLSGIVACHDVYIEYKRKYFAHFEGQIGGYAIGKFDIYEVLNGIIAAVHKYVTADAAGARPTYMLTGKQHLVLLPLIGRIYPHAEYVYLRPSAISRWMDSIASSRVALSKRAFSDTDKYDPYEGAWAGRSFDRLLRTLTKTGKYNFREIRWSGVASGGRETERLLSGLGIAATDPIWASQKDNAGATPPVTSSPTALGYLQVIPEFSDASPIFVLGAGRSGTSAMVGAMNAAGIEGFSEGHLFPMLDGMAQRLWQRDLPPATPPAGLGGLRVRALEVALSTAFASTYGGFGQRMWIDKTPDHPMIESVPFLHALFPRAKFLMMVRHPVAFAESRRRKFGEPLLSAANEWVRCVKSWRSAKSSLATTQYLEVDLDELNGSPLLQELCSFLALDDGQRKKFTDYLATERPELTRVPPELLNALDGLDDERRYNLRSMFYGMLNSLGEYADSAGWDEETTKQIVEVLGTLPEEYRYKLRRPTGQLESLLLQWARQLEEYRYTAEYHEKNAAYWAEQAGKWKTAAECREER